MRELIAIGVGPGGGRYELVLRVPDDAAASLDHDDAQGRLQYLLQREADRAAIIADVAHRDRQHTVAGLVHGEPRKGMVHKDHYKVEKPGPNQIAFAGTDESIDVNPDGTEAVRRKAGKPISGTRTKQSRKAKR